MMRRAAVFLALLSGVAQAQNSAPRGDVTGDGAVSAADAQAVLAQIVALPLPVGLAVTPWGDANCNGTVEAIDAQIILTRAVGGDVGTACVGTALARVVTIETSTPATNLAIGGSATLTVTLRDSAGVQLTGRVVRFVSSSPTVATVAANGAVTGAAPGPVTVTVYGEQKTKPVVFSVADAAGAITLLQGDQQVGFTGKNLLEKIKVRVTDAFGVPVPGKAMAVTALTGGGAVNGSATTNGDGIAEITYTLGSVGENSLSVNTSDGPSRIALTLRADAVSVGDRLAGGFRHTCFVSADGLTRCWGHNIGGVLGTAALTGDFSTTLGTNNISAVPILTDGGLQFRGLFAANVADGTGALTCGLTNAGSAFCWGTNFDNALGVGTTDQCTTAGTNPRTCLKAPRLISNMTFESLAPGALLGRARLCGIEPDGDAFCWGDNTGGTLGTGSFAAANVPTPVQSTEKFVQIGTGRTHTCGLTTHGQVYCWGGNRDLTVVGSTPPLLGQLGSATAPDSTHTPVLVAGIPRATWLSVANNSSCAGTASGAVWCWGGLAPTLTPADLSGGVRFRSGRTSSGGMCGIAQDDLTYCYVNNAQAAGLGVPGNGLFTTSTSARPILGGYHFSELGSGSFHVCGVVLADNVYCWGNSNGGQVGTGVQNITNPALNVAMLSPAKVIFGTRPTESASKLEAFSTTSHTTSAGATVTAPIVVRVTGASGFGVPNATVRVFVRSGGGGLGPNGDASIVIGSDSAGLSGLTLTPDIQWRLGDTPGANRLVFKVDGSTDSVVFNGTGVVAGSPTRFVASTGVVPVGTENAKHFVTVVDAQGLPVRGVPVLFGAPGREVGRTDPELPATIMTDDDGRATITMLEASHTVHLDSVLVSTPGLASAQLRFSFTTATRARLAWVQLPANGVAGVNLPSFAVTQQDEFGNTLTNTQTITLTLGGTSPNTSSLQGTLSVTSGATVTFGNVRIAAPGSGYQIIASSTGVPSIMSQPFSIAPAAVTAVVADRVPEAFNTVDTPVATTPRVLVKDGSNVPLANVPVTFRVVSGGGTLTGASTVTNGSGLATLSEWTLGPTASPNVVEASVPGALPVSFTVDARYDLRLSAGPADACALTAVGATHCWGLNSFSSFGAAAPSLSNTPVSTGTVPTISRLAESMHQAHCGVNASVQWICWGRSGQNELGDNLSGVPAVVSSSINFKEVALGRILSCGLDFSGTAYCFGLNQAGGFGRLADTIRATRGPAPSMPVDGALTFSKIFVGWQHACALTADGTAWCWGLNGGGELGVGTFGAIEHTSGSFTPQQVLTTEKFRTMILGSRNTCAINLAGRLFCWGLNANGQLGDGTQTNRNVPTPVARELRFAALTTNFSGASSLGVTGQGSAATTCALTDDGQAHCWGANGTGQIGDGTTVDKLVPTPVATTLRFNTIDIGDGHSCAMRGNQVWCWGNNANGAVGDGTNTMRLTPVRVQTPF